MSWQPKHEIRIEHDWHEIGRSKAESGTFTIMQKCQRCGDRSKALGLSTRDLSELSDKESRLWLKKTSSFAEDRLRSMEVQDRKLVEGTGYGDLLSMLKGIDMQYDHTFSSGTIPIYIIKEWTRFTGKKSKRKILLLFRQGWVCNRCDHIFPSGNDLTVDHILPRSEGGQTKLNNLQLLCRDCNEKKGDESPSLQDVSPFSWQGPSCIHRMTCIEIAELRRS